VKDNATYTIKDTGLALQAHREKGQWTFKDLNRSFGNVIFCYIPNNDRQLILVEKSDGHIWEEKPTQWTINDLIECDTEIKKVDVAKWKIIE
jgi:hypothetical protein